MWEVTVEWDMSIECVPPACPVPAMDPMECAPGGGAARWWPRPAEGTMRSAAAGAHDVRGVRGGQCRRPAWSAQQLFRPLLSEGPPAGRRPRGRCLTERE